MTYPLEDEFGDIISKARSGQGIDPVELARACGIRTAQLSSIESYDWTPPDDATIECLAGRLGLDPKSLVAIAREAWVPKEPSPSTDYHVERLYYKPYRVNMYIVWADEGQECLVVDPGGDAAALGTVLKRLGRKPAAYLITHRHHDHTGALETMLTRYPAPVCENGQVDSEVKSFPLKALHTPGHTADSTSFLIEGMLFVGDALFAGSIGRSSGSVGYDNHLNNLKQQVLSLSDETAIYPGHGPATTLGQERRHNPFLVPLS